MPLFLFCIFILCIYENYFFYSNESNKILFVTFSDFRRTRCDPKENVYEMGQQTP